MPRATWNGAVLAESDRFEDVEGNVYFPPEAVNRRYLKDSTAPHHVCVEGRRELLRRRRRRADQRRRCVVLPRAQGCGAEDQGSRRVLARVVVER